MTEMIVEAAIAKSSSEPSSHGIVYRTLSQRRRHSVGLAPNLAFEAGSTSCIAAHLPGLAGGSTAMNVNDPAATAGRCYRWTAPDGR